MSQTEQADLTGETVTHPSKDHLTKVPQQDRNNGNVVTTADKSREWFCTWCGRRVTEGPDGQEFGHHSKRTQEPGRCPHRDSLNRGE